MVCEKCQSKLNRVICPDVAKKPLFKASDASGAHRAPTTEESKEAPAERKVPLYKRNKPQQ